MENEIKEIDRKMDWYLEDSSIHDFITYEPVSYTHLDVYKRQLYANETWK